jgi:pimeloyl-ACP methyl ester carboxylesterase
MVIKFFRFLVNLVVSAFVFLIIVLLIFDQFVQFRMDDHDLYHMFHKEHLDPYIGYYTGRDGTGEERKIRYLTIGEDTAATILFVHGAPSSLSYWRNYLMDSTLLHRARLYAVDRPGYGYSGLGDPQPDIHKQALLLKPLLDSMHLRHRPVILVGASYGTAVVSRLAMDYPGLVDGIVLVAPALAPGEEKMFWFTPAIEHPILRWFVPRMLQSANTEKLHHKEELEKMLPLWPRIKVPVIYLQGADDDLVYTTNANFARQHLAGAPYFRVEMIPKTGHLIAFLDKDRVEDAILQMINLTLDRF